MSAGSGYVSPSYGSQEVGGDARARREQRRYEIAKERFVRMSSYIRPIDELAHEAVLAADALLTALEAHS